MRKMNPKFVFILFCYLTQTALCQTFMVGTKSVLGDFTLMLDSEIYHRDTLDCANFMFTYNNRICIDPNDNTFFEEKYILLKGDRFSKYQCLNKYLYDRDIAGNNIIAGVNRLLNAHYAFCYDALYLDSETGEMEVACRLFQDDFLYEEHIPEQKWIITDSTKLIDSFWCRKAESDFRGRKYVAWYTDEVPLPIGPWKLHGLPGLIIYAYDTTGQYSFMLDEFGTTDAVIVKPQYNYISVGRNIFNKLQAQYVKRPLLYQMSHSGPGISVNPSRHKYEAKFKYDILETDY